MYNKGRYLYGVECWLISMGPLSTSIQCSAFKQYKVETPIPDHLSNSGTNHEDYEAMQIFLM